MIVINKEFLEKYLRGLRYDAYKKTKRMADHLSFHFNGVDKIDVDRNGNSRNVIFQDLIYKRRPSESDHIKEYRSAIYLAHTMAPCSKVLNSLNKIVKAPDWNIDYSETKPQAKIKEGETLENYCEKNYPCSFKSIENWAYNLGIKEILTDPNGLIAVLPMEYDVEETEFSEPFGYFIKSENVWDYVEEQYVVFQTDKTSEYTEQGKTYKAKIICIVTPMEIWEATQINKKGDYSLELKLSHNIGKLPVFRAGGLFKEILDNTAIYESFVSPILPGLDAAAREISDLDAEVVQHIFSTMWYYASQDCQVCNGVGKVQQKQGTQIVCSSCGGSGAVMKSPYKDFIVKPPALGENSTVPTPPAGYIQKQVEIVKIQDDRIKGHVYSALSAINMEFLTQVPLSQSGIAKEVDRDELNNFVYRIAYHLVENVMKKIYFFVGEYRYTVLVPNIADRIAMIPNIIIPERFEMLSDSYLSDQVSNAIAGKQSPVIINNLEIEYVSKKFANYPKIRDKIITGKQLDPLPALSIPEKWDSLLVGIVTKEDAILSIYMTSFVERAVNDDAGFLDKKYDQKLLVLQGYAKEKVTELDAAEKLKAQAAIPVDPAAVPKFKVPING